MKPNKLKLLCDERDHMPVYEFLAQRELKPGATYKSPMRDGDQRPSFSVFISKGGKVLWKDFAYGEGDVYAAVMQKYNCDFQESVRITAGILGVTEDQIPKPKGTAIIAQLNKILKKEERAVCWYKDAEDLTVHKAFLAEYRMNDIEYAITMGFIPVDWGKIRKGSEEYVYRSTASMWAIKINSSIKFYRPGCTPKYIGNTIREDVYGLDQLVHDPARPTIIMAGHKDKLVGGYHLRDVAQTICMNSEGIVPDEPLMMGIFKKSSRIFVWYDNDKAGILGTKKLIERYPFIRPIYHMSQLNDVAQIVKEEGPSTLRNEFHNQTWK